MSDALLGAIAPAGNSTTRLRALRGDDGRVRLEVRDEDWEAKAPGETTTVALEAGDRVEVTSVLFGGAQCVGSETDVTLVRGERRTGIASFRADSQWGGVLHADAVALLRVACAAAGAVLVEQKSER